MRTIAAALAAVLPAAAPLAAGEVRLGLAAPSPALGAPLTYSLYLPDGGARDRPVLYLLHGYGADDREWLDLGGLEALLDRLIEAGEIRPLVAVMPDAEKSWYVDSAARGGPGDYETAIARDLVDHVDVAHGTRPDRAARAVAGLSMGGFGALRLGFAHPGRFATVVALSPAVFDADGVSGARWSFGDSEAERQRWFPGTFGVPFDVATYRQEEPFALVAELAALDQPPRIWLAAGDDDGFGLHLGTAELFLALRAAGVPAELRIADGGHDWDYWRRMTPEMLRFVDAGWTAERE